MKIQNQRQVYGETLLELGRKNKNIVVLEADLGKSTMTSLFEQEFPERFFEMGIGEANMTSFAAGLSLTGKIAFTNSFAVFAATLLMLRMMSTILYCWMKYRKMISILEK